MTLDAELLRRYAEGQSEDAFAELVRRHLDLVYSAALRQTNGDAHLAQDVAQTVFTDLARKAAALSHREVLTGWLFTSTHFAAAKAVRKERRRHMHEQEAHAMQELVHEPAPDFDWEKLRPVLDRVMHELNPCDREVILMRYFENRQLADIGERLGLSEDAARKRVDRAVQKLRCFLSKRGITTTAALATVLSAHAVQVAPAGLAATLASASLAGVTAGTGTALTFIKLMTMNKLQLSMISALAVVGVATPLVIQRESRLRQENRSLRQQIEQLAPVQAENEHLSNLLAQANNAQTLPNDQMSELLRLRGEVGSLRRQTNELGRLQGENQKLRSSLANSKPGTQTAPTHENLPKESWVFAGYADPESAFQSAVWAMSQGDAKTFLASLAPEGAEFAKWHDMSDTDLSTQIKQEFEKVTGFKIIDKEAISDDAAILTVLAAGINESARFKLQRVGNDWKVAGHVDGAGAPDTK